MPEVDPNKILFCRTRREWRVWLAANYYKEKEIWLSFPHKSAGLKAILYNDAVEEALCFGWIDSTRKSLNPNHSIQRFSPRRKNSAYSQPNLERLRWLLERKKIHKRLEAEVKELVSQPFVFPQDILDAIRKDKAAWKHFRWFSDSYKRIRIAYIDGARKRPAEFEKRLANFICKTRDNKLITGYGGVEKYYQTAGASR